MDTGGTDTNNMGDGVAGGWAWRDGCFLVKLAFERWTAFASSATVAHCKLVLYLSSALRAREGSVLCRHVVCSLALPGCCCLQLCTHISL